VILRIVGGHVRPGDLDDVLESFRATYQPLLRSTAGLRRFVLGVRPGDGESHHLEAFTIWESIEATSDAYGGDLRSPRTIDGRSRGATFETVAYYELEAGRTQTSDAAPTLLRLTAGTVSRGHDAEIQQDLRGRLSELPDEVVEAYVGRRVRASQVEIAFLSTWSSAPDGRRLDAPIWPEISDRYDTFALDLLDIALTSDGPSGAELPSDGRSAAELPGS
jgi:hypothetical protein